MRKPTATSLSRRLPPYEEYKDSSVDWIGAIPAGWDSAPLYAKYEVTLGKMLNSKKITGSSPGSYIRNTDVRWGIINTTELPAMDFSAADRVRFRLKPGDLLVCEGGEIGRTAIWDGKLGECFFQKALHRLRPLRPTEEPRFFYYVMCCAAAAGAFVAGANSNTIDHLTAVKLRHHRFPFPPLSEQHAIAAFLDRETAKIDALVAKKERLIELLQEKRTALITHAVTKGLDPDASMKDSGVEWLGEVPSHWEVRPLRQFLLRITYGFTNPMPVSDDGPYMLTANDIGDGKILYQSARRTTKEAFGHDLTDKSRPLEGDILLTKDGSLGRIAMADGTQVCINQSIALLRLDRKTANADFVQNALRASIYQDRMLFEAGGTTIKHIYISRLAKMPVAVPPTQDQERICRFVTTRRKAIFRLISIVSTAIEHLKEYRTALISAAVTGKIDVREEVA